MGSVREVTAEPAEDYLELDAADRVQLRQQLRDLKLDFQEDGVFTVRLAGRSVNEVVRGIEVPITRLSTRQPSLEEAYLKILAEEPNE
jgi:hypothetical protein